MDFREINGPVKLNIGAGGRRLPGYLGVDAVPRPAADIVAKADKIPLPDGCAEEIIGLHIFEHFYRWECDEVIKEWKRLLMPGGRLILELPNMIKCCENIISGRHNAGKHPDQLGMWGCWGDPRDRDPFMNHKWGWSPESLSQFLSDYGFTKIREVPTQWHPAGRMHRDMRIECELPSS